MAGWVTEFAIRQPAADDARMGHDCVERVGVRLQVQEDVNRVFSTGYFANCQPIAEDTRDGVRVVIEVRLPRSLADQSRSLSPPERGALGSAAGASVLAHADWTSRAAG